MSQQIPELDRLADRIEERLGRPRRPRAAVPRRARGALTAVAVGLALACTLAVGAVLVAGNRGHRDASHRSAQPKRFTGTRDELAGMLAVLRRPQDAAERAIVRRQQTDRYSGLPSFSDPGSVRILAPGLVAGGHVFLYLAAHNGAAAVCVYYPDIDGGGVSCATAKTLSEIRTMGSLGTETFGLVPDGVTQVELSFPSEQVKLAVDNNFWQFRAPANKADQSRTPIEPLAVVWKSASGQSIDPGHERQPAANAPPGTPPTTAPAPPSPKPKIVEQRIPIMVRAGHRIAFVPRADRHRYEVSLHCGRRMFDGAITKALPGGRPVSVRLSLAAARYRCPRHGVLTGKILDLTATPAKPPVKRVVIAGRFRLRY